MDLNLFWHSIRASAGNSFLWETAGPNIFRGEYHDSFNMDLMCKDIQLCFDMAKSAKVGTQYTLIKIPLNILIFLGMSLNFVYSKNSKSLHAIYFIVHDAN